jgi:hypothetical protein
MVGLKQNTSMTVRVFGKDPNQRTIRQDLDIGREIQYEEQKEYED